jgi:hypothetical protein
MADDWGEPSIGVNWKSEKTFNGTPNGGTVMSYGGINVPAAMKVTFDDTNPAAPVATWEAKTLLLPAIPRVLGDPILFTDHETGRTFVSQLLGGTKQSTMEFTDNDGDTFTSSQGSGINSGVDHQTIGGGPLVAPLAGNPVTGDYKNGVWYCAQDVADANCALSVDGGQTFGPAVPIYTVNDCAGLHGHLKVAKDGTMYVPNRGCGGDLPYHENSKQAVIVSGDNGVTWQIRKVSTSTGNGNASPSDPSVGIATDGTLYFGYQANDGHARIAVSKDKGQTWINDYDVGASLGIQNSIFPAVVAGDPDRAAFAFFGTTTGGSNYDQDAFPGVLVSVRCDHLRWRAKLDHRQRHARRSNSTRRHLRRRSLPQPARLLRRSDRQTGPRVSRLRRRLHRRLRASRSQFALGQRRRLPRQVSGRRMFAAADSCGAPTPTPTPTATATPTPTPVASPTPTPSGTPADGAGSNSRHL